MLDRLEVLASSARTRDGDGVTRLAWSADDLRDREQITSWAEASGLVVMTDAVGNVIAELSGSETGLAPFATGSHLDTVIDGGRLDGAYGVVAAFAVLGALAESGERLRRPLRAVAWANEEGVVAPAFTGSRAAAGESIDFLATGSDGITLSQRITESGGDPGSVADAAWERLGGYFELHIEQGPVLDHLQLPIGVVTGITACFQGRITFTGRANHAGTTPMHLRHDGLVAAARSVLAIDGLARDGTVNVATAGSISAHPGNTNVIAGRASVSFDLRAMDDARCETAVYRLRNEVAEIATSTGTEVELVLTSSSSAVATDPQLREAIADAADRRGLARTELASGAGHDAQHLANIAPVAMIFVPSIRGVSHNPAEETTPGHLVAGAEVLLDALRLADRRLDS